MTKPATVLTEQLPVKAKGKVIELRPEEQTKRCPKCEKVKAVSEFRKDSSNKKSGLQSWCGACANAYKTEYRKNNVEKINAYKTEYRKSNPEKVKAYSTEKGMREIIFKMQGLDLIYPYPIDFARTVAHHRFAEGPYSKGAVGDGKRWLKKIINGELPLDSCVIMDGKMHRSCSHNGKNGHGHCNKVEALIPNDLFPPPHPDTVKLQGILDRRTFATRSIKAVIKARRGGHDET